MLETVATDLGRCVVLAGSIPTCNFTQSQYERKISVYLVILLMLKRSQNDSSLTSLRSMRLFFLNVGKLHIS